mmetsp:Transcript_41435/g.66575  ORF Transcript_41435/g.66575 Transcript_41435/m.66575 type:complete len:532 (+) Transcript_41435:51-1646(+)
MSSFIEHRHDRLAPRFHDEGAELKEVNLADMELKGQELQTLAQSGRKGEIERLNVAFNMLCSLRWVSKFTSLVDLNVSHNSLQQLGGIEQLRGLTNFDCSFNDITSLLPLKTNINIRVLVMNNNHVACIQPLKCLQQLELVHIYNNPCAIGADVGNQIEGHGICAKVVCLDDFGDPKILASKPPRPTPESVVARSEEAPVEAAFQDKEPQEVEPANLVNNEEPQVTEEAVKEMVPDVEEEKEVDVGAYIQDRYPVQSEKDTLLPTIKPDDDQSETRSESGLLQSASVGTLPANECVQFYENTKKQAIIFQRDGSCLARWPNDSIAVSVERVNRSEDKFRTLAVSESGTVLASFDDQGSGTLNHPNGKTFLSIASSGHGLVMNKKGEIEETFNIKSLNTEQKVWTLSCGDSLAFRVELNCREPKNNNDKGAQTSLVLRTFFKCRNVHYSLVNGPNSIAASKLVQETSQDGKTAQRQKKGIDIWGHCELQPKRPGKPSTRKPRPLPSISSITAGLDSIDLLKRNSYARRPRPR